MFVLRLARLRVRSVPEQGQCLVGAYDVSESTLISRVLAIFKFPSKVESARIIEGLRRIGMLSDGIVELQGGNLFDTLCAWLEWLMEYEEGGRDLLMLQVCGGVEGRV